MNCSVCGKEQRWLSYIGEDIVCSKCIVKETVFKEVRFSDEKRLKKVLRTRKITNFKDLKKIDGKEAEKIMLEKDNPELKKYKETKKEGEEKIPLD
ncbi:MAG: hypothetical protein ABII01_03910 [Candidatus Woesearchaeota archaeon]